jgi:hypothetical protein
MHRAGWVCADLVDAADIAPFGDDGLGHEFAAFIFRPLGLLLILRFLILNGGVLVTREYRATFLLPAVRGADLHQLRLGGYGHSDVC